MFLTRAAERLWGKHWLYNLETYVECQSDGVTTIVSAKAKTHTQPNSALPFHLASVATDSSSTST